MARFVSTNNNDRGLVLGIYLALSTAICWGKGNVFGGQWGQNKGIDDWMNAFKRTVENGTWAKHK